ncbi:hypothetical protein ACFOPX_01075 [Helicobacter baculiformis]|uniref:Uncharacterized protein n=1 Tax=Helicobacter baculiformis TaxID=427351 RepID=A0ABV7ZF03_9HELI|nr:hypothetical protein [Helicobacter baculiformis]
MRLVWLCVCAFALLRSADLSDARLLEMTRLDSTFNVHILQNKEKIFTVVADSKSDKVYAVEDFLKRATPKQKAFIQARMQEARALAATPPKIKHLFNERMSESQYNDEDDAFIPMHVALLSLKPLPGTNFQIATIKDYALAHDAEFYGQQTPTYSTWLLDQNLSFAIRLERAFGPKQALQEMTKSIQWAKEASDRYYTHDFNTLFDRIPKSSIITLRSKNPHAKQLYILLATDNGKSLSSEMRAYKHSLEIVKNLPQMLKNATLHLVPTQSKWTYDAQYIEVMIQKAHCLKDNHAKIAWIQEVYNALTRSGEYGGCQDGATYLGDKFCSIAPSCPALKDYAEQHEWLEIFFGQGACGDGVKDWHPLPIVYEYKED